MKILFAPIGDPSGYVNVEYLVNGEGPYNTNASFIAISQALKIDKWAIQDSIAISICFYRMKVT